VTHIIPVLYESIQVFKEPPKAGADGKEEEERGGVIS
jgi:hypothetical protein